MSAGQPRKRPTTSSLPPPDHHRSRHKRPKLERSLLSLTSHVRLRWDGASRRAVPAQDQIGISWSRLAPFVHAPPRRRASRLADVVPVPREIFSLDNLRRVLSYEVWDKCLTEADMEFLAQFLPTTLGTNTEETVHSLLTAKNHHFGNPMLTWSSALCYGDLHPDAVLAKERQIRADRKAYQAQLNDYHSDITETLTKWKDRWLTCHNPQTFFRDNPAKHRRGDHGGNGISSKSPNTAIPIKVVRNGDVTKYMSYIKVTRSQHDLVKRMKQSGDGIQTKNLTAVIGDIDNFHVKPYETLMEDEKNKLHSYWAILSSKELPAAFEARRERKSMAQNLMTSLCLELEETAVEEAEQVADRTRYQNGGISDEQEEPVDDSPEDVPQAGHNSSAVHEDEDDNDTSDTDTSTGSHDSTDQDVNGTSDTGTSTDSHDSPNMSDQDAMDMNNTNITTQSQGSADEQDQELENTSGMNTSAKSGNSSGRQDEDMEDTSCKDYNPDPEDQDTSCKDTALQDHNIPDMQAREPKAMNHTISPIHQGLNSPSMLVQDFTDTSYAGFPIHSSGGLDDQTDDLKNMYYPSASTGHDNTKEMNRMILDQGEPPESITVMPSDSTVLFSKPLHEQNNVEEGPELKGPAEYQKVLWQSVSPVDSLNRPPGNGLYAQPGALQLKHHLSGGPAASLIDLGIDDRRQQQAHIAVTAALPMCSPASLLQPFTNQLNDEQLLNNVKSIGMVPSYSVGHMKQSVELHSISNGHLAQSGLVLHSMTNGHLAQSGLVQEQMQLLDESQNGIYSQQVENNMYSGSTLGTFPMVDPQNFAGQAPAGQSRGWFPNEQPSSHNNWSGMGSNGMVLGQDVPSGDGSLSSVLSHYKQVSSVALSSDESLGRRNLVPSHGVAGNMVPSSQNVYAYPQNNVASSQRNGSLQWAQGSHGNGMAYPSFRQFGGDPWSR